ncbi:MAG: EscU/YscU/HrcU family type III secretion system export apparatus switch protein, partial [Phycisphaerales bacterium]|nr:EscU/YscU/HrcU family type III secretion system export apparatus switch protein [Phycisphaerales bacterium]
MAGDSAQDRTEAATPKRREESRAKGDVVDSKDLASGFTIFGVAMLLVLFGPGLIEGLKDALRVHFGSLAIAPSLATKEGAVGLIRNTVTSSFGIVAPIVAAVVVVALAAQFAMHGLV